VKHMKLKQWLALDRGQSWLGVYALTAAFMTYFSMYAFRKPLAAASYDGMDTLNLGVDFKIAILSAQVLGYACSKFLGIKFVSEAKAHQRAIAIVGLITVAECALVGFAVLPGSLKLLAVFLNGLPLGMVWGLVFAYLEGRRISDVLGAGLCASFIVSSGAVKSVGRSLVVDHAIPELWMPALTGLIFFPLLALSVFLLSMTPPPDRQDREQRMYREPMDGKKRRAFFMSNRFGLMMLIIAYITLTLVRDFRDNFAVEVWSGLGYAEFPSVLALAELPVATFVLLTLAMTIWIRKNEHAVYWQHFIIFAGGALLVLATLGFVGGLIGPVFWMVALGTGTYMGYVPFNSVLPDRLTAALRLPGNAAFFIYLADASGYAGSVLLMLTKGFVSPAVSWVDFLSALCTAAGLVVMVSVACSAMYFHRFRFS